jgi:hypothetical protein
MVDNKVIMPGSRQYLAQARQDLHKIFPKDISNLCFNRALRAQLLDIVNFCEFAGITVITDYQAVLKN